MNLSNKHLYIPIVAIVIILFTLALWILPQWQSAAYRAKFTDEEIQKLTPQEKIQYERNVADIEDKTRLTLAQIIGGLALLSGLYFTYKNIRVNEEGKITERFSKAVELLGSEKLDVRLGGIYALERIARDSQKDHWTVMEVLTAFVRENAPYNPIRKEDSQEQDKIKPREDTQAIMTVIDRRKWRKTETQILNFQGANLARCVLYRANLRKANLCETNLSETNLRDADLFGADLSGADLSGADLYYSNLFGANLKAANLTEADLFGANLVGANLNGADLTGANLQITILYRENLTIGDLSGANISLSSLYESRFITLEQILQAKSAHGAILSPELRKELEEWQTKKAK